MSVLYVSSTGKDDATKASIPWHLAVNGSIESGQETGIVLVGDGVDAVLEDNAETMEGVGLPPIRDLLAKAKDHALPIYI